jgi:hypothetical protein
MRDSGCAAFPRPHSSQPGGGSYDFAEPGMSYRDWLVGKMMIEWWAKTTNLTPTGKFWMALAGEEAVREAVKAAHGVVDEILKERHK